MYEVSSQKRYPGCHGKSYERKPLRQVKDIPPQRSKILLNRRKKAGHHCVQQPGYALKRKVRQRPSHGVTTQRGLAKAPPSNYEVSIGITVPGNS
jgi:hypothetical protein